MDDRELGRRLGAEAPSPDPSPDALRAIVARSSRRQQRLLGGGLVVMLIFGLLAGVGLSRTRGDDGRPVAAGTGGDRAQRESPAAASDAGTEGQGALTDDGWYMDSHLERLFLRTTGDGVAIRAYLRTWSGEPPEAEPCPEPGPAAGEPSGAEPAPDDRVAISCAEPWWEPPPPAIEAGLSTDLAVTQAWGSLWWPADHPTPTIAVLAVYEWGVEEGSPATVVVIRTEPGVEMVRVRWADGHVDEMAPVVAHAVLARTDASLDGVIEAIDATGNVVATSPLEHTYPPPPPCPPEAEGGAGIQPAPADDPDGSVSSDEPVVGIAPAEPGYYCPEDE